MDLLGMVDTNIVIEYLKYPKGLNVDFSFLDSIEKMKTEKKKYGLSVNEKFGLIVIGATYTTVLTSDRFLLFCNNGIRVKDIKWSYICDVTHKNDNMVITFNDGLSWTLSDRIFCDDIDVINNYVSTNSDFIISIINQKINGKNNLKQVP